MPIDLPDYTEITEGLFIGNLASATTLPEHPERGVTHILSVCHEYPETSSNTNERKAGPSSTPAPSSTHPRHHRIAVHDSEYEALLPHLPAAVAFIREALDAGPATSGDAQSVGVGLKSSAEDTVPDNVASKNHRVLVHCVMGISRSVAVVCAYLMAKRHLSPAAALRFIQRRRPQAQPNFGFRRQLAIFAEQAYFADHPDPVTNHPLYSSWMRKCNREAKRFLARMDNIVEVGLGEKGKGKLSMTDDFPVDPVEAATLLADLEVTHFLSVSPASMPALPPSPPSAPLSSSPSIANSPRLRPGTEAHTRSLLQHASLQLLPFTPLHGPGSGSASVRKVSGSPLPSPQSSRSSSFSSAMSPVVSGPVSPTTAATSVMSLPGTLAIPSKLRLEASSESDIEEEEELEEDEDEEPTFLVLARARHYHLPIPGSGQEEMSDKMREGALFVHRSLVGDEYAPFPDPSTPAYRKSVIRGYSMPEGIGEVRSESGSTTSTSKALSSEDIAIHQKTGKDDREAHVLIYSTTESRACSVVCAYFMAAWGVPPAGAFDFLREDQPLFNPTKGFMSQLEHFHTSKCAGPSIHTSLSGDFDHAVDDEDEDEIDFGQTVSTAGKFHRRRGSQASSLLHRLGTPARCGSFATGVKPSVPVSHAMHSAYSPTASASSGIDWASRVRPIGRKPSASGRLDDTQLEALLRRCEGAGAPGFAFDVEAFRGALRAVESKERERTHV